MITESSSFRDSILWILAISFLFTEDVEKTPWIRSRNGIWWLQKHQLLHPSSRSCSSFESQNTSISKGYLLHKMIAEIEFIRATISYSMEIHDRVTFTTILQSVVIPLHLANFTAGNLVSIAQLILHLALCSVLRRKVLFFLYS
ncbi:hypothetical protein ACOSQ2_006071 [Xanthoceras sorbifolium]